VREIGANDEVEVYMTIGETTENAIAEFGATLTLLRTLCIWTSEGKFHHP
jgi:hypothetical protein